MMIQLDEVTLSNSSLNNIALVKWGIAMKKQHYLTTTFLQNETAQPLDD